MEGKSFFSLKRYRAKRVRAMFLGHKWSLPVIKNECERSMGRLEEYIPSIITWVLYCVGQGELWGWCHEACGEEESRICLLQWEIILQLIGAKKKCQEPFGLSQGEGEGARCQGLMQSPLAPASPSPSLGFTPSGATAGFTCLTQALFVGIKKNPMSTSRAASRGAWRERKTRRVAGRGWDVQGLAGEQPAQPRGRDARAACELAGAGAAPGASGSAFP